MRTATEIQTELKATKRAIKDGKQRVTLLQAELDEVVKAEREAARAAKANEQSAAERFNQERNRRANPFETQPNKR